MGKRKRHTSSLKFRSGSERKCFDFLCQRGVAYEYEHMKFPYVITKTYLPDFYLPEYDFYIEVKGRFTSQDRSKHLFIREQHPELDIRFMFDNPNSKLYKGSSATYGDWANKHNYLFCKTTEGIPKEWFRNVSRKK